MAQAVKHAPHVRFSSKPLLAKDQRVSKRKPTILDVAEAAGVSSASVSRVVNEDDRVSEGTRRRVLGAIKLLGYRHNALARSLVTGKSGVLGVIIPDVAGPLYAQIARGVEDVLEPCGMNFMMVTSDRDAEREAALVGLLLGRKVDGLILIGGKLGEVELESLVDEAAPLVLMQRESREEVTRYSVLTLDNAGGSRMALGHLYAAGHRHIAHISGVRQDGEARLAAYLAWMAAKELPPLVLEGDSLESGGARASQVLSFHPEVTAVFCSNDRVAMGLYRAFKARGLHIPEDLSIVGFDDLPWCAYLDPPLTSVRQDGREMGRMAAREVLEHLGGNRTPRTLTLPTELVERESVRDLATPDLAAPAQKGGASHPTSMSLL